jgi:hypothetical protein
MATISSLISPARATERQLRYRLLLPLLAVCALVPLLSGIWFGFDGVDINYHIDSWVDMVGGWRSGVPVPGWAAQANFGLGDPRYCFYPPLPMWIGSLLTAVLPARLVLGVIFWATFLVAGLSMDSLARRVLTPARSLVAALLYVLSFFLIVTALKHGAVAELMTDALLPWLMGYFLDAVDRPSWAVWGKFALLLSLTWLTDVPVAVAIGYTLTIATAIMAYRRGSFAIFLRVLSAQAVGVLCAAFYLLPAFAAQGTIRSTHELAFHVRTLFVSRTLQDLTLSADACAIGCLILYCIWRRRRPVARGPAYIMVLIGLIGLFFQMPFTHWLWLHAPELYIVGFPHRFQVFLAMALPFAVLAGRTDRRFPLAVLAASLALTAIPFYSIMTWVHRDGPLETGQQKVQAAQAGYPGAPEYLPRGTGAAWIDQSNRTVAESLPLLQAESGACFLTATAWQPQQRDFAVRGTGCIARLKLYLHPFWHFTLDGRPATATADDRGLAEIAVPAGEHTVTASFERPLAPVIAGAVLSALSLLGVLWMWRRAPRHPYFQPR